MKFWKDCWLGEVPLALTFPSLFDMPSDKDVWVSSYIQDNNWALSFRHPLCLARLQMLAVLTGVLQRHTFRDTPDQVIWKVGSSASFTVRSQYKLIQPLQPEDKVAKFFWKAKFPPKVKMTTWLAVREQLLTSLCLQRRHVKPSSHYVFCDNHAESSIFWSIFLLKT